MPTPYEVQVRTARGWTSCFTHCEQYKAHAEFLSRVAVAEDEGRIEDYRLIERRGRGETVLAISTHAPEPSTVVRERALEESRRCPDEARMRSAARSMTCGSPAARTKLRETQRLYRMAELDFARKPDAIHASIAAAYATKLASLYGEMSARLMDGEQVMI